MSGDGELRLSRRSTSIRLGGRRSLILAPRQTVGEPHRVEFISAGILLHHPVESRTPYPLPADPVIAGAVVEQVFGGLEMPGRQNPSDDPEHAFSSLVNSKAV